MKLFSVGKVPMYCEGITHRIERRKSGDAKVVDLQLRIEPFTAQLAAALDQTEYAFVRRLLFTMNDASPVIDLKVVELRTPADRQKLLCFPATDTVKASIALDQVKVTKIRARKQKAGAAWVVYLHVSFGPLGKSELEYVNAYYTEQRFITFEEAEPSLEFEEESTDDEDEPETRSSRPQPMFDDPRDAPGAQAAAAGATEPARHVPRRHPTKKPH